MGTVHIQASSNSHYVAKDREEPPGLERLMVLVRIEEAWTKSCNQLNLVMLAPGILNILMVPMMNAQHAA